MQTRTDPPVSTGEPAQRASTKEGSRIVRAPTIAVLEEITGVPRSTIELYTRRGLLPQPARTATGRRLYSDCHVELLKKIEELKRSGLSLQDIRASLEPVLAKQCRQDGDLAAQEHERIHRKILQVATEDFIAKGYQRSELATVIRRADVTPHVFYSHFPSKPRLLAECFDDFVKRVWSFQDPQIASTPDLGRKALLRMGGNLSLQALTLDVETILRTRAVLQDPELRSLVQEPYEKNTWEMAADIVSMRPQGMLPPVPDELVAQGLIGGLDEGYMRSLWDETYSMEDLLRTELWRFLALQAAMGGDTVTLQLQTYEESIRDIAARAEEPVPSLVLPDPDSTRSRIIQLATERFVAQGYEQTQIAALLLEAGVSPQTFYRLFESKSRLLVECFDALVRWNSERMEPEIAATSDLGTRMLLRLLAMVRVHALGGEALTLVRSEGLRGGGKLHRMVQESYEQIVRGITEDLATMHDGNPPLVHDELLAYLLLGTFERMHMWNWDGRYTHADLLRTHLWLFLSVQVALIHPEDINRRLSEYPDFIEESARRDTAIPKPIVD